jgi:2-polyprenyl-3-methyl-5-hydroxy-6-metoxy-1,4-benzoquinol methylase
VGTDIDDEVISAARGRGLTVWSTEDLPEHLPARSIDVLTLWDVIEHVEAPRDFLAQLLRYVCPGGLVVLEAPDASFVVRPLSISIRKLAEPIRLSDMLYYRSLRTYFTRRGLSVLMADCGLDVIHAQGLRSPSEKMERHPS